MAGVALEVETNPPKTPQVLREVVDERENKGAFFGSSLESQEIAKAELHVWSIRIDGQLGLGVRNTGRVPMVRTSLTKWRTDFEGHTLHDTIKTIGILRGNTVASIQQGWTIRGPLTVLWNLIRILFTGSAKVQQHIVLEAVGYKKEWRQEIMVPVRNVAVRWD